MFPDVPSVVISSRTALMYISGWDGNGDISCYDYGAMDGRSAGRDVGGE